MSLDFEWDAKKSLANESKHGVSFFEAAEVFGDDYSASVPDPDHSQGEARFLLFGVSRADRYLVVSFTERYECIRIISARPMTRRERKAYES